MTNSRLFHLLNEGRVPQISMLLTLGFHLTVAARDPALSDDQRKSINEVLHQVLGRALSVGEEGGSYPLDTFCAIVSDLMNDAGLRSQLEYIVEVCEP